MSIKAIKDANKKAKEPFILYFTSDYCAPCKKILPIIEKLGEKYVVYTFDVEKENEIVTEMGVQSLPTILIMKDGEIKDEIFGLYSKRFIESKLQEVNDEKESSA